MRQIAQWQADDAHYVSSLCFTADGALLLSGLLGGAIKLWDTGTWRQAGSLEGHTKSASGLAAGPDNDLIASGSSDQTVRLWSLAQGRTLHVLQDRKQVVPAVAISADGAQVAAVSYGGRLAVWTRDGEPVLGVKAAPKNLASVQFSPDGALIAVAGLGGTISVLGLPGGEQIAARQVDAAAAGSLAFLEGGRLLAALGYAGRVRFWESGTWKLVREEDARGARGVTFAPDGRTAALAQEGRVELVDVQSWSVRARLEAPSKAVSALAFAPGGARLAVASGDGAITIFEG